MARYALVIGIEYEDDYGQDRLRHSIRNATEINNFFINSGFDCSHLLLEKNAGLDGIHEALNSVCETLNYGDTFCLYFSGHGFEFIGHQYIHLYNSNATLFGEGQLPDNALSIEFIEKISRKSGVERVLIMDLNRSASGRKAFDEEAIARSIQYASDDSPISVYCGSYCDASPLGVLMFNESFFTSVLLKIFEYKIEVGLEISFPSVCNIVLSRIEEWAEYLPKKYSTCYRSSKSNHNSVIHSGMRAISDLSNIKRIKAEADTLLETLLAEHVLWRKKRTNPKKGKRLTFQKLKPIIEIYKNSGLGSIKLTTRNLTKADFSSAEFPEGMVFAHSILSEVNFSNSVLSNIDFSYCKFVCTRFERSNISSCNFNNSRWVNIFEMASEMTHCIFDQSSFRDIDFSYSHFINSSFKGSFLAGENLSDSSAINCDFTDADFAGARLINTDLSGSILTGARLYGSSHTDWCIEGVECQYVYWDREGKERFPPENDFHEGEFSKQYRHYTKFSCPFKEGITPLDLMLATHIVDEINAADLGFIVRVDNASVRGLNPTLNFIIEKGDEKRDEAKETFSTVFERLSGREDSSPKTSTKHLPKHSERKSDTELLMDIRSLVQQGSQQGLNKLAQMRQFLEGSFQSVMTHTIRTAAREALQDYLLEKPLCSESYDMSQYRYLVLYGLGSHTSKLPDHELELLHTALTNQQGTTCLALQDAELNEMPKESSVHRHYEIFSNLPEQEAFIAMADLTPGAKANHKPKTLVETVCWDSSTYAAQSALTECAERLRFALDIEGLDDLPRPPLPTQTRTVVLPNRKYIKEIINNKFSTISAAAAELSDMGGSPDSIRKRLFEAAKGTPVKRETMDRISKVLGKPVEVLFFDELIVKPNAFKSLREESGLSVNSLADKFGIKEPFYFNLLEDAQAISGHMLIAAQYHYKKILGAENASFEKLVDWDRTRAHHQKKFAYLLESE